METNWIITNRCVGQGVFIGEGEETEKQRTIRLKEEKLCKEIKEQYNNKTISSDRTVICAKAFLKQINNKI